MSNSKIVFTQEDKDFILDYAQTVMEHKGEEKSLEKQLGKGKPIDYVIKGYAGEYAIHKFYGQEMPPFDPHYTKKDIILSKDGKEYVCDIKTSIWWNKDEGGWYKVLTVPQFIINQNKENIEKNKSIQEEESKMEVIDAYIAVEVDYKNMDWAEIHGIISWKSFLEHQETHLFKGGKTCPSVAIKHFRYLGDDLEYVCS